MPDQQKKPTKARRKTSFKRRKKKRGAFSPTKPPAHTDQVVEQNTDQPLEQNTDQVVEQNTEQVEQNTEQVEQNTEQVDQNTEQVEHNIAAHQALHDLFSMYGGDSSTEDDCADRIVRTPQTPEEAPTPEQPTVHTPGQPVQSTEFVTPTHTIELAEVHTDAHIKATVRGQLAFPEGTTHDPSPNP